MFLELAFLKNDVKEDLRLKFPKLLNFPAVVVLWAGVYGLLISMALLWFDADPNLAKITQRISGLLFESDHPWIAYLFIAILPAILEELLFRGFVLSKLSKYSTIAAVVASSALFACYHFNSLSMISMFLLGIVLAYVTLKSDSVYPAIFLHIIHNGFTVYLQSYQEQFSNLNGWLESYSWNQYLGLGIIFLGIFIIGIGCVNTANKKFKLELPTWLKKTEKAEVEEVKEESIDEEDKEAVNFVYVVKANKERPIWQRNEQTGKQRAYQHRQRQRAYRRIKRKEI